jgi:hypothetical protein
MYYCRLDEKFSEVFYFVGDSTCRVNIHSGKWKLARCLKGCLDHAVRLETPLMELQMRRPVSDRLIIKCRSPEGGLCLACKKDL